MYREFTDADIHPRHVVMSVAAPTDIASSIFELVHAGSLVRATEAPSARPS